MFSRYETVGGKRTRKFYQLKLERERVMFMPLHWVVVHPIREDSPLVNTDAEQLGAAHAEFLVLLSGVDETFSTEVHTRTSYRYDEVRWGTKFSDVFGPMEDGVVTIDLHRIHDVEPAE